MLLTIRVSNDYKIRNLASIHINNDNEINHVYCFLNSKMALVKLKLIFLTEKAMVTLSV